jgi:hypothetical protein
MALTSDPLQRSIEQQFGALAGIVARLAEPFVAKLATGELSAITVAEDLLAFIEGAIILSRARRDPRRLRNALKRYASSLRLLRRS